ncbi:MAG: hypothetical protein P1V97_03330 [Planctomycetota bacterium]|nr:hypothetical protein [Planctomycetota bacterium]
MLSFPVTILIFGLGSGVVPAEESEEERLVVPQLKLSYRITQAPVSGFVRVPKGGQVGSSSFRRPNFSELGITRAQVPEFGISGRMSGAHGFYLSYKEIRLGASGVLTSPLISQSVQFPAGEPLKSDLSFTLIRLGYSYALDLYQDEEEGESVLLTLRFGALYLRSDIQIEGREGREVDRNYGQSNLELGFMLRWQMSKKFAVYTDASYFPVYQSHHGHPGRLALEIGADYTFYETPVFKLGLEIGVGYESIQFLDDQDVPNRIELRLGPSLTVGLSLSF